MAKLEPIEVQTLAFVGPQDGPGLSVAGACSTWDKTAQRPTKYRIQFWPWVRQFFVEFDGKRCGFIPESRVMWWEPVEAPQPPSQQGPPRKG